MAVGSACARRLAAEPLTWTLSRAPEPRAGLVKFAMTSKGTLR